MGVYVSNESGQLKKYSGMRRQTEDTTKANITGDNIINRAFLGNLANGCLDQRQKEDTYGRPVSGDDCTSALEIYNLVLANPNTRVVFAIGASSEQDTPVRNVLGNPTGFANYTYASSVRIMDVGVQWSASQARKTVIELYAVGELVGKLARGYIFNDGTAVRWSGWEVIK